MVTFSLIAVNTFIWFAPLFLFALLKLVLLDDTNSIIMVDQFNEEDRALLYHDLFKAQQKINAEYPSLKFDNFVISKTNFNILYQTKELDTYKRFYTSHY